MCLPMRRVKNRDHICANSIYIYFNRETVLMIADAFTNAYFHFNIIKSYSKHYIFDILQNFLMHSLDSYILKILYKCMKIQDDDFFIREVLLLF